MARGLLDQPPPLQGGLSEVPFPRMRDAAYLNDRSQLSDPFISCFIPSMYTLGIF